MRLSRVKVKPTARFLTRSLLIILALLGSGLYVAAQSENVRLAHIIGQSDTATNYNYTASWLPNSEPSITNSQVQPGQSYKLFVQLQKNNAGSDSNIKLTAHYHEAAAVFSTGNADQSTPAAIGRGLSVFHCTVGYSPCWYWEFSSFSGGQTATASFNFTVLPTAPAGSSICFYVKAHSAISTASVAAGEERCLTVASPTGGSGGSRPYLTAAGGDVQAGASWADAACLQPDGSIPPAQVRSQVGATGSSGQYVVSAGGSVDQFGSAGNPNSPDLTLANYGQVCRPDLAKRFLEDPGVASFPSGAPTNFGMSYLNDANFDGMAKIPSSITFSGGQVPRGKRITLIVDGDVLISGNTTAQGGNYTSAKNIPSLGIIATGNINISPSVSQLYGIYYAGSSLSAAAKGNINTCQNSNSATFSPTITSSGGASACNTPLSVNGALVATNIYWRRTGGDAAEAGSPAAESVNYTPMLMLRPPLGLGGVTSQL